MTILVPQRVLHLHVPLRLDANRPVDTAGTKPGPGGVYHDAKDANRLWYVPTYALADDVDPVFSFLAEKTAELGDDGNPYFTATLTVGLRAFATDAAKALAGTKTLSPIPIEGATATLTLSARDASQAVKQYTFTSAVVGNHATFTLGGKNVLIAYQSLQAGGATIAITGTFVISRPTTTPIAQHTLPTQVHATATATPPTPLSVRPSPLFRPLFVRQVTPVIPKVPVKVPPPHVPTPPAFTTTTYDYAAKLDVGTKFHGPGYGNHYNVTENAVKRVIHDIGDLRDFDVRQSDFRPFTELGEISQKYPSFSRLYIGVTTRAVVAVPARYGILRGARGTSALCDALLDGSATGAGKCRFQFSFTIGPAISAIDLLRLQRDVAALPASADCPVVLPSQLDPRTPSELTTTFQSAVTFDAGPVPSTFQVAVMIADHDGDLPAVAVANKFISQLTDATSFLAGKLHLHLDDDYVATVDTSVILSFAVTSSTDELAHEQVDEGIALTNASPLDVRVLRYLVQVGAAAAAPTVFEHVLAPKDTVTLPCPDLTADTLVAIDGKLEVPFPLTHETRAHYLAFRENDVQSVLYQIGVTVVALDLAKLGVARIDVAVMLTNVQMSVPSFVLTPTLVAGSQQIVLPIQYAMQSLDGIVMLTVHAADPAAAPVQHQIANDFLAQPVVLVMSLPPFAA